MTIPDPEETARAALEPGESLVWAGRPDVAPLAWRQFDLKASLLAAPAALVAAILVWNAVAGGFAKLLDYLFVLAAVVALCVAVWPLAGPLRAARGARHTVYAITDRRLFILELYPRRRLRSFAPAELEAPRVQDRGKGRGDVIFGWAVAMEQTRQGLRNRLREATFVGVPDAERVAARIATLRSQAPARSSATERPHEHG